jgi:hypothetical protein
MDYALVDEESRKKFFTEKGSYSAQDEKGQLLVNDDMDVALLMLYGHILYAGTSYPYALSTSRAVFASAQQQSLTLAYYISRLFLSSVCAGSWKSHDQLEYRPWLCSLWPKASIGESPVSSHARPRLSLPIL